MAYILCTCKCCRTPAYSCLDGNISKNSTTPEYWESHSINESFQVGSIAIGVVLLVIFLIGLPGNTILIISMIQKRFYKDPTHILLLNLAISDLLVCLLVLPLTIITAFSGGYIFGDNDYTRCQVCQTGVILVALTVFSLNMLGLISLDRFIFVKFPLAYDRIVTLPRTITIITILWLLSIFESILPLFGFGEIRYTYSISTCAPYLVGENHLTKNVYYLLTIVLLSLVPITVMIIANSWIICIVRQQLRKIYRTRRTLGTTEDRILHNQKMRKEIHKKKNKKQLVVLRAFGAILVGNVITWSPMLIHTILLSVRKDEDVPVGLYIVVYVSLTLHCVLHPLIEAFFIPEIKAMMKKCLRFIFCINHFSKSNLDLTKRTIPPSSNMSGTGLGEKRSCCVGNFVDICSFALISESAVMADTGTREMTTA